MNKATIVRNWMNDNYVVGSYKSIRAIWYNMKPYMQQHGITDTVATRYIGEWLWKQFVNGNREVYGAIGNSSRVEKNKLPIILFCEKNTLAPFADLPEYIYSNVYMASGQTNSYEIANLVNSIDSDTVYLYLVTDFDKAGDDIAITLLKKLSMFFDVTAKKLEVQDITHYETYTQPNGNTGLELDAVYNLEALVLADLESWLPYYLFREVSIYDKRVEEYNAELETDDIIQRLSRETEAREKHLWQVVGSYTYNYILHSNLYNLPTRVQVTK